MRIFVLFFMLFMAASNLMAANIYIRDDGGSPAECDGTVDAPKNATKKCAYNFFSKEMIFSATSTDNILLRKGKFIVSVRPPNLWITLAQFNANPEYYIREVKRGRVVYFSSIDGLAYELILRKY